MNGTTSETVASSSPWRPRAVWIAAVFLSAALALVWASPPAQAASAWLPMAAPAGFTMTHAAFVSADEGWVAAYSPPESGDEYAGSILRTTDGGAHWETVYGPDPDASLGPLSFLDDRVGWAVVQESSRDDLGDLIFDYYLLSTIDGGEVWTKTTVALDAGLLFLNDIEFAAPSTGFIVGSGRKGIGAVIFRTTDGGATWAQYDTAEAAWSLDGLYGASFVDGLNGWAVACWESGAGQGSAILHTGDGGLSWQRQYGSEAEFPSGDHPWFGDVDFVDSQHGWVVGDAGLLLRTADGGATWRSLEAPTTADLRVVDFLDSSEGWVAGAGGSVFHTEDAGGSWEREAVGAAGYLTYLRIFGLDHGVALTSALTSDAVLLAYGAGPMFGDVYYSPYVVAIEHGVGSMADGHPG